MKKLVERTVCDFCGQNATNSCQRCKRDMCYSHGGAYFRISLTSTFRGTHHHPQAQLCDECAAKLFTVKP